ncbi:hypothetical protein ML462_15965 [Gramella lutea]|uniref:Uncharacterized protein n=1 Tax=Christiangramia lutea TaxID=1607951 RepID=A0A9X2ACP1_9FLAO|nr:hypothetical protein [Christiangramia lutea]MCH4824667.1 hypothetical protein [Christiangramia lutea]
MKNRISVVLILLMMIVLSQNIFAQNSIKIIGKVSFFENDELAYGANIETYKNNQLVDKINADLKSGNFDFTTSNKIDKIVFSFSYCYSTILENINNLNGKKLDLNEIKIYAIPNTFTRYATKEAERKDRKESRQKFRKLKKGIIIKSGKRNYLMRLKKRNGEYAFYIDFKDFQNKKIVSLNYSQQRTKVKSKSF